VGRQHANRQFSYLGTKWRPLSMPVTTIAGGENAYEEAIVGRYSYLCVNLSDMFNVNECLAAIRTNGISLAHLFIPIPPPRTHSARRLMRTGKYRLPISDGTGLLRVYEHRTDPTSTAPTTSM
jgi:hypothetical protein